MGNTLTGETRVGPALRFTPTRVGNTQGMEKPRCEPGRFTPTRVGNTIAVTGDDRPSLGSPPHAWGIRWAITDPSGTYFGSPPHAWGIRLLAKWASTGATVHPHTRGEYVVVLPNFLVQPRFTPTRVGNTPFENGRAQPQFGSPPHAWGIRLTAPPAWRSQSVHPHTRGEYDELRVQSFIADGSPPHAWGIRAGR